jgi:mRNA interferase MazF
MYQRGDVVLIPLPYTDLSARKTRPAIVVSGELFHARRSEILLMYVSSQVQKVDSALDYLLEDWQEAKLLKPSLAKANLTTAPPALVQSLAENSLAAAVALASDADRGIDLSILRQLLSVTG